MKFLWRQNWTDMPVPVEVDAWMRLTATTAADGTELEAEVVGVALIDGTIVKITLEDLVPDYVQ